MAAFHALEGNISSSQREESRDLYSYRPVVSASRFLFFAYAATIFDFGGSMFPLLISDLRINSKYSRARRKNKAKPIYSYSLCQKKIILQNF